MQAKGPSWECDNKELAIPVKQITKEYDKIFAVYKSWGLVGSDYGANCQELLGCYGYPDDLARGAPPCPSYPQTASEIISCLRNHLKSIKEIEKEVKEKKQGTTQ